MIIFPHQITAEQMGFTFEFLLARIISALGRTFQNLEKSLKMYLPSTPINSTTVKEWLKLFQNSV